MRKVYIRPRGYFLFTQDNIRTAKFASSQSASTHTESSRYLPPTFILGSSLAYSQYQNMENVFRSDRLIYRAIEDTPDDGNFMHLIQSDPVAFSNSDNGLLAPMTKKESGEWKKSVQTNKLIGVIICLAPPPSNPALPPNTKPSPLTPIGCISLTGLKPGYFQHRNSYISIDITAPYQRKGYGSEAIKWILDWGFRIAGLHRIGIECFSYNTGARELYERKLGFVFEGRKRELLWYNGGWHDLLSFSMLEREWKKQVQGS